LHSSPAVKSFSLESPQLFTAEAFTRLAIRETIEAIKNVTVTLESKVAETGEIARYARPASEIITKLKSEKSAYAALLKCLGGTAA
jgi:hypothetical protein